MSSFDNQAAEIAALLFFCFPFALLLVKTVQLHYRAEMYRIVCLPCKLAILNRKGVMSLIVFVFRIVLVFVFVTVNVFVFGIFIALLLVDTVHCEEECVCIASLGWSTERGS